jgi:methionyl-tRNA synthetase
MLTVSGFKTPTKVNVHGFLTVNGEKMSKSRGTFILAKTYLETLDPAFLRYYYASKLSGKMDDLDLSLDDFLYKVNSDVVGKVVNIGSRLGAIVHKKLSGSLTTVDPDGHALLEQIRATQSDIEVAYEALDYHKAMRQIMACADLANQYIDQSAPWQVAKEDPEKATQLCTTGLNALRYLMIYLKPVLPTIASGVETFLNISPLAWGDIETVLEDHEINLYQHLASRLTADDLKGLVKSK